MEVKEEELGKYPVRYNYIDYEEEDCVDIFVNIYHNRQDLNFEGGLFLGGDMWVYPDGSMREY